MTHAVHEATTIDEVFRPKDTVGRRIHRVLHRMPWLTPLIVLVLAMIVFGLANNRFFAPANLSLVLQQMAPVAALAVAQTLVILTAGIDLSIGAVMVLASLVMAKLATDAGVPGPVALLVGLLLGLVAGFLNGWLVASVKLPPFIVTLGTLSIFTALTLLYAGGVTISLPAGTFLTWTGTVIPLGGFNLTVGVLMMLVLYAVFAFVLTQTAWGKHLYATGDDPEAARLAGIHTKKVLLSAYVVAGAVIAVGAWIMVGRISGADPNSGTNANLESITAVVIGGTSLFGGRGAIVGSLIGALIVQVFENGLALVGVDPYYQVLAVGVLVILAVAADQWIRRVRS
jgi:fructose transport system permease protein